jgi:hypothetical protein
MPQVFSPWALDSSAAIKDQRGPVCALCEPSMRPSTTLYILLPTIVSAATTARRATEVQEGQTGTLITSPPLPTNTGLQQVPDANHPFIAPGPNDQRGRELSSLRNDRSSLFYIGSVPYVSSWNPGYNISLTVLPAGMNTLANHGYIPRKCVLLPRCFERLRRLQRHCEL